MADVTDSGQDSDDYMFHTNEYEEAVAALEVTAAFLRQAEGQPALWRLVIVSLHSAVQGFMVVALKGSQSIGALTQYDIGAILAAERNLVPALASNKAPAPVVDPGVLYFEAKLADFLELYERIKKPKWPMRQFVSSTAFRPRGTDTRCIKDLNRVRNEFIHFKPMHRSYLLTQFPAMVDAGLHVIEFLLHDSNNVIFAGFPEEPLYQRSEAALREARDTLGRVSEKYAGKPRPKNPLCGSRSSSNRKA